MSKVKSAMAAGVLLAAGCGDGTRQAPAGLSHAEVEAIVSDQLAQGPAPAQPQPVATLTAVDVQEAIAAALADMPRPEPGLSRAEVEEMVRSAVEALPESQPAPTAAEIEQIARSVVASVPSKSAPAEYTRFVVDNAVRRYEAAGLDATLAYYNHPDSVDGQWYVFIIDENDLVIGHPDPGRLGLDLRGWVGTDVNGYNFGPEMLSADETGKWVPYVYTNPALGTLSGDSSFELKNAWVVRHDGLLFGSGWYIDNEQFLPALIAESVEHFRSGGLEAILAFYNDPQGVSAGLIPAVEYYNSTNTLDGYFSGFIAAPDGEILTHFDPAIIGTGIEDLLGPAVRSASPQGTWITAKDNDPTAGGPETMRIWVVNVDGTLIGGGWYNDGTR